MYGNRIRDRETEQIINTSQVLRNRKPFTLLLYVLIMDIQNSTGIFCVAYDLLILHKYILKLTHLFIHLLDLYSLAYTEDMEIN